MTQRFKMFGDVAKVREQANRAKFNQIPKTQNSVHQHYVHVAILYSFAGLRPSDFPFRW